MQAPRRQGVNPKGHYTIFSPHSCLPVEKDVMTYITFDPGEYTFDVRVERRTRGTTGTCSLVETVAQNKHRINCQRDTITGTGTVSMYFSCVTSIIEEYRKYLDELDIVIVERQMEANTAMMVLQTTIVSYFLFQYPAAFVVDMSARMKGDHLGAPVKHTYDQLKAWGITRALALAAKRGDTVFIAYITAQRDAGGKIKMDDDTDNYMQAEAFCAEVGYQLSGDGVAQGPLRLVPTATPRVTARRVTARRVTARRAARISSSSEDEYVDALEM